MWFFITYLFIGIVISFALFGFPPRGKFSDMAPWMVIAYPIFGAMLAYAWWINRKKYK